MALLAGVNSLINLLSRCEECCCLEEDKVLLDIEHTKLLTKQELMDAKLHEFVMA